jgi:hypothetical protein
VIVDYPTLMFMIIQVRNCSALMVPVAIFDPGADCLQPPSRKAGALNPATGVSVTVKEPGPNVTNRKRPSLRLNADGRGSLPVTVMKNSMPGQDEKQFLLILKGPVIGGVRGGVTNIIISAEYIKK